MRSWDGKVVTITGAASGLGRALAVTAADRGALVAISDIDEEGLATTEQAVSSTSGDPARVHRQRLDVSDAAAFTAYAAAVEAHFGRVNVLVNNAGVSLTGDLVDLSPEDIDWIIAINLGGVIHGTRAFLPSLIASGDGHLVNISSLFGLISMPGQSVYNATKYAVRGLTESVRQEMLIAGHPVAVTCVHPGGVRTGIARNGRVGRATTHSDMVEFFDRHMARLTPEAAAQVIVRGVLAGKPRVLVGADAHLLHQAARLGGARYQDAIALISRRRRPR
jgi:NADP-dependent 3-hydroxy acid dehydrogenase YdfG